MDREAIRKPVQRKRSRRRPSTEKRIPARRAMIPPAKAITVCRTRPSCGSENLVWRSWLETKRASEEPSRPNRRISPQSQAWKSSLLSCRMFTLSADPSSPISVEALMAERILLVDDHPLTRSALAGLLTQHGFEVVGEAADGEEAIEAAARLQPDLILLDLSMPGLDGLSALPRLRVAAPDCEVVVLTASGTEENLLGAIRGGAAGCSSRCVRAADAARVFPTRSQRRFRHGSSRCFCSSMTTSQPTRSRSGCSSPSTRFART